MGALARSDTSVPLRGGRTGEVSLSVPLPLSAQSCHPLSFSPSPPIPFPLTAHVTWDYGHIHHWMFLSQEDTRSCSRKNTRLMPPPTPQLCLHVEAADLVVPVFRAARWDTPEAIMLHDGNFHFVFITVRNRPPDPYINNSSALVH